MYYLFSNLKLNTMNICFIPVILLYLLTPLAAQSDISRPIGYAAYLRSVSLSGETDKNGTCVLLFNTSGSLFIHSEVVRPDSTYSNPEYVFPVTIRGDKQGFPVYKSHKDNTILYKTPCRQSPSDNCIVKDTLGSIDWALQPGEHKRFGTYTCEKAVGTFRGRTYEVWYAPDIPVPSGPFKLGGLPGLILEAKSTDGKVQFLFKELVLSKNINSSIIPPDGFATGLDYGTFREEKEAFDKNLIKSSQAQGIQLRISSLEMIEQ